MIDLDQLIRDADPARTLHVEVPDPRQITRSDRRPRRPPATPRLAAAASVLVVLAVVATVIAFGGHGGVSVTSAAGPLKLSGSRLAIFARSQTARDRTLLEVERRALRLEGTPRHLIRQSLQSDLSGIDRSSIRYAQTLPDGREVFVAHGHVTKALAHDDPKLLHRPTLATWIIAPNGSWRHGDPIDGSWGAAPRNLARWAQLEALHGGGCAVDQKRGTLTGHSLTVYSVEPNNVARVRWQFAHGSGKTVTVEVPVHGNTAVATVPGLSGCTNISAVTLYDSDGQIIAHRGPNSNIGER